MHELHELMGRQWDLGKSEAKNGTPARAVEVDLQGLDSRSRQ